AEGRVLRPARCVHVDLHEIGAEIDLMESGVLQSAVVGGDPHVRVTDLPDPGAGHADIGVAGLPGELVSDVERYRSPVRAWCADVASPQDAGLDEALSVLPRHLAKHRRWIVASRDPVAATL